MEQTSGSGDRARYANMTREERLREFEGTIIMHPHLMAVIQACCEVIREPSGILLVFVCGPVGVGKNIIKNHVTKFIVAEISSALQESSERVPVLSTIARPPLNGSFSWKDFLQSSLLALEQSPMAPKNAFDANEDKENASLTHSDQDWVQQRSPGRTNDNALRISLETAIKRHRPAAVIIDDAQYLGKVSVRRQLQDQLDCIRALAEITETVHILIGTYEMLSLYTMSPRLIRRSLMLHFTRYSTTTEELLQFKRVLSTFQELLPFEEETDVLLKHLDFCYERSLGCVGILHTMLVRAVHAALRANEKTLSQKYLVQYALSKAECDAMMQEVNEGEKEWAHFRSDM